MNDSAITMKDVRKNFGASQIIRGLTLDVQRGERHALIGPNGAGKSTTFGLLSGGIAPTSGQILLNGKSIGGLLPEAIYRRGLSRSFQISNLFPSLSVFENLRCGVLWTRGVSYAFWKRIDDIAEVRTRVDEVLELIGLAHRAATPAGYLSYAEQRALEIGIAVAGGGEVLLLDEPTAGMSAAETRAAVELIRKVSKNKTLLMVEHDMGVVFDLADRISVLVYGEVIATDTPEGIRRNELVRQAYLGTEN